MRASNDNAGKTIVLPLGTRVLTFFYTDKARRQWMLFEHSAGCYHGNANPNVIAAQPHPIASILTSSTAPNVPTTAVKRIPFTIVK
jgi:hypothetical protein